MKPVTRSAAWQLTCGSVSGRAPRRTSGWPMAFADADQFGEMGPGDGSPAGQIVRRLGEGGGRAADHLEDRGPRLLDDVQQLARRKPGTFLLIAAAAGFAIGRLGRAAIAGSKDDEKGGGPTRTGRTAALPLPVGNRERQHRALPDGRPSR